MPPSKPIRTALIGLSGKAATSWASSAHLPYLLSPHGRESFVIVALLNSSVNAARAAIAHYGLPGSTRPYGDPAALAADPDVDFVVCCTRVDLHAETIRDSVQAGKSVFVEWPLAQDVETVRELVEISRTTGGAKGRTVVGIQGSKAPVVKKVAEVLESGRIGKVLSSEVWAAGGTNDRAVAPVKLRYFFERAVGGNVFTIGFAHLFDSVQSVLGEVQDLHTRLQLQRPQIKIREPATSAIVDTITSNVPDLIYATGTLPASETVEAGASFLFRFRRGQPFKDEPALVWTINGVEGEIRLVSPSGTSLQANGYLKPVTIEVHDFATDQVETVTWEWEPWQDELPIPARSIAALYEAFANDDETKYPTFEYALRRHEQLAAMLDSSGLMATY